MPPELAEKLFSNVRFLISFDGDEYEITYRELTECFQQVFKHPSQWAEPIKGSYTIFDKLPATKINTHRFAANFIAKLALQIHSDEDLGDSLQD